MTSTPHREAEETAANPTAPGLGTDLVKICGLREPEHAAAAARAGADLLGFIFAPARRQVTAEAAGRAIAVARASVPGDGPLAVGVFVDADAAEINRAARIAGLDLVQLHGDESPDLLGALDCPVIKVVRPQPGTTRDEVDAYFRRYQSVANAPVMYMVEGYSPTAAGGAGVRADWTLARDVAESWPVSLSGGLNPEIIGDAIQTAQPTAVDVSSGVERDGVKDPELIAAFVARAQRAFGTLREAALSTSRQ
jgi:phosphoribosylanthranilate isomerase